MTGIAISHPHYYTTCQDWAAAFDCPVYLHAADRAWVMRPGPAIRFWEGDTLALDPDLTLIRLGGHFPGAAVAYWTTPPGQDGVLLTGDTLQVVANPRRVTFLWSYPNKIPLSAGTVRCIADNLGRWHVDRVYVRLKAKCLDCAMMRQLAMRFRGVLRSGDVGKFESWLRDAHSSWIYGLRRFAGTLQRDLEAVRNAITEPWSNGQVEGQTNRVKKSKRPIYGRAGVELLRAHTSTLMIAR